ncbi:MULTISPECIES: hypothetical protein [unclassified Duganella]|uniref:hypothetical protein n=1 Tax=unclassified Duganella TaxID=2636909 RepID=UPI0006F34158|nr:MULTISPECIES: hypothetical protein [unclassified Duganella]KQV59723.1 hypothetical protein ASD07_23175 [Duganella sp. Root336D2]KRB87205.1 hypothetical protein ASE26_07375 [Duganella sp. Root198D2]
MKSWLQFGWKQLGPAGRVGAWLLLAAALLLAGRVLPAWRQASLLATELQEASAKQRSAAPPSSARPSLQDFYQHFPKFDVLPDQLAQLDAAAGSVQLRIGAAQYQLQPVPSLALQRYQVALSIGGDYASLRAFLNMAMNEASNATLDETRFERDAKGQQVTAHLRISFYYQAPPPAPGKGRS